MNEINPESKTLGRNARVADLPCAPAGGRAPRARRFLALALLLAAALAGAGCFESKVVTSKVTPLTEGNRARDMNGVFYALPRTVVKADVPVVRTDKQPGVFSTFTPCFFPDEDYIAKKSSEFAVDAERIKFDTLAVPDTDEIYMIKTRGGMFETRNLEMTLTENGVLVKASADVTNETIDIVTGSIKTGAGLLAKALPIIPLSEPIGGTVLDEEQKRCRLLLVQRWVEDEELAEDAVIGSDAAGQQIRVRDIFASAGGVVTLVEAKLKDASRVPDVLRSAAKFKTLYEEAKEVSDRIDGLLTRRGDIVGQNDSTKPDVRAETVKLVLDEIDKNIKELKETYFFGTKSNLTWNASFRLNPTPTDMSRDLFTLSKEHGVCDIHVNGRPNNGQGVALNPKFRIRKRCRGGAASCKPKDMEPVQCVGQKVKLEMALGENGEGGSGGALMADRVNRAGLTQQGNRGFFYRIPGRAIAFVRQDQKEGAAEELARTALSIAQFGQVVSLPASTGGRKTKYTLELFESSGGMKNFVMGSSALIQQKNIDDLAGAASTLIEAKGERNKAKAPADELQQLERQRKILEEKKKIRDLERELSGGSDSEDDDEP
jgi:hypothetical protein